jgi:uncharacterized protein (TIGR02996 family)
VNELSAFLEAIRRSKDDDTPRLVFADWLDENHPSPAIRCGELPAGFNTHWNENVMPYTLGVRPVPSRKRRRDWTDAEILADCAASAKQMKIAWWARAGAAEISGYPVLVSEPNLSQSRALRVCRALQWAAGGCPVSLNRCPQRGRLRITFWFTARPPEEQRMSEVARVMEEILGGADTAEPRPNVMAEAMAVLQPRPRGRSPRRR